MNILEKLSKPLVRTEPDVWISRVVIYGKLGAASIRDIRLKKGLNIVWAEEPEEDYDKRDVAGHSAGKTTFCRLLRYVLGEKTFANKSNTALIKRAFPNGYVAAELSVKDVRWAVLRPLGENRNSYVRKNATVEELIEKKGDAAYQETYPQKIGLENLLEPLASATVVRTNDPIQWGHILAWCARDQEARFQNLHEWRSHRSDSDSPAFRFPKADPLFVMRVVLGLFLPDELRGEEDLSKLQRNLEKEEAALEVAKKEPAYWHEHYDQKLRQQLATILKDEVEAIRSAPFATDEMAPDLQRFTAKAKYLLGEQIDNLTNQQRDLQREINRRNELIAAKRKESEQLSAIFQIEANAEKEAVAGVKRSGEELQKSSDNKDRTCPYGDILIGECSYVLERQRLLKQSVMKDAHSLEQMEAKWAAAEQRFKAQQQGLEKDIQDAEQERAKKIDRFNELTIEISTKKNLSAALDADLENVRAWKARHESPDKYAKLKEQVEAIDLLKNQVAEKKADLNRLLADHDVNRALLNTIFSTAARNVLPSANYDGKAQLVERELHFQITKAGTLTGEAMETLAVLLADISCVIYNAFSENANLPGFLLHDSPREADLGLRLYRGFFRFAAQLQDDFEKLGGCPFQYIITTTTPPPETLANENYVALQLDASKESELLFRRDLSKEPEPDQFELIPGR